MTDKIDTSTEAVRKLADRLNRKADQLDRLAKPSESDLTRFAATAVCVLAAERDEAQADFQLLRARVIEEVGVKDDSAIYAAQRLREAAERAVKERDTWRKRAEKAEAALETLAKAVKQVEKAYQPFEDVDEGERPAPKLYTELLRAEREAVRLTNAALRNEAGTPINRPRIVTEHIAPPEPNKTWRAYSPERRDLGSAYAETEELAKYIFRMLLDDRGDD